MPVRSSISHAVIVPSCFTPIFAVTRWSRAWMSVTKLSSRSATNFTGRLQQLRQRDRRHLVRVGVHLDAERAADVLGDDAHLLLFQAEMLGEQVLHHVRRLRRVIRGHALLAGIPVGDDRARLVAHAGVAAEPERRLDHFVGVGEALVGLARLVLALEGEVVAELRVDHRRAGIERGLGVGDGGQVPRTSPRPARTHPRPARASSPPPRTPPRPASTRARSRSRTAAPT